MRGNNYMRRVLKVRYVDFSPGLSNKNEGMVRLLGQYYDFVESKDPDYLISGGLGCHHLNYDCVKILTQGENDVPNFNDFDYAIGYNAIEFGDRYLRARPSSNRYRNLDSRAFPSDEQLLNRGFCSFVVSNGVGDPMRELFFKRLSQYKPVASGGRWMNNVGGPVANKREFCRKYKFNIAFENSVVPGYTTEKLYDAFESLSVPVYYGNPTVGEDFNVDAMVVVKDRDDVERAVEEIIRLDRDDAAYLAKCKMTRVTKGDADAALAEQIAFWRNIFDQPIEFARRTLSYGYQATQRRHTMPMRMAHQYLRDSFWFMYELVHGKIRRTLT